jgi:hypothetical protein
MKIRKQRIDETLAEKTKMKRILKTLEKNKTSFQELSRNNDSFTNRAEAKKWENQQPPEIKFRTHSSNKGKKR